VVRRSYSDRHRYLCSAVNVSILLDKVAVDGHDQQIEEFPVTLQNQTLKMAKIPVIDFSSLSLSISDDAKLNESDVKKTADQLVDAFTTFGFAYLSNTGFSQQLVLQHCSQHSGPKQAASIL